MVHQTLKFPTLRTVDTPGASKQGGFLTPRPTSQGFLGQDSSHFRVSWLSLNEGTVQEQPWKKGPLQFSQRDSPRCWEGLSPVGCTGISHWKLGRIQAELVWNSWFFKNRSSHSDLRLELMLPPKMNIHPANGGFEEYLFGWSLFMVGNC